MLACASKKEDQIGDCTVKWGLRALAIFFLGLIAACVPRLLALVRRFRLARRPQKSPQMAASIWYERMLRQALRRGFQQSLALTPADLSSAIDASQLEQ